MVRHNITRWRLFTCNCVVERVTVADDKNEKVLEDPKFLLMNKVCPDHKHLASTTHKENHQELAGVVHDYIEEAKRLNLEDWQAAYDRCETDWDREEVRGILDTVQKHNNKITREWGHLTSFPHAFDSHIHTVVETESNSFSSALSHMMEHFISKKDTNVLRQDDKGNWVLREDRIYHFAWEGQAPDRILHTSLQSAEGSSYFQIDSKDIEIIQQRHDLEIGKGKVVFN